MKIVVGIDAGGLYQDALNMTVRLRLDNPEWVLVHSVETTIPIYGFGSSVEAGYGVEFAKLAHDAGTKALEEAQEIAKGLGVYPSTVLLSGGAAAALTHYADESSADLIAVQSERKGRLGSLFFGSIGRGLAIGSKQSVLIVKGKVAPEGPINLVFATDHSEYAKEALAHFISMGMKGVANIKVVSALHLGAQEDSEHRKMLLAIPSVTESLKTEAQRQTDEAMASLRAAGFSCTGEVVDASANDAISQAMLATNADLLVMGAQGHGFMHRLMLGSTSLHQVMVEPHSVMIIRSESQ